MPGYDVIVVGARVAGAGTALLLARAGLRVLVLDRAGPPADTLSSHQVQLPGVAQLHRWGLLDRVLAAGTPTTDTIRFDFHGVPLHGRLPSYDGVATMISPRRTVLDTALLDAAREAGAHVRTGFRVEELIRDGDRVTGVRGRERTGPTVTETATVVVGADGKGSLVAEQAHARVYRQHPTLAFASYGYFAGVPMPAGELYLRPGRAIAAFPTNDDLTMVYVAAPRPDFAAARTDLPGHHLLALDGCTDLADRVRAGRRVGPLRTAPEQPGHLRQSYGPGWALVGDAATALDSITAQGISNALRDADSLAHALLAGLSGETTGNRALTTSGVTPPVRAVAASGATRLERALAAHQRRRHAEIRSGYDFTVRLARFAPPRRLGQRFLAAVADRPAEVSRLLGAFAGCEPVDRYFSARTALRVLFDRAGRTTRRPSLPDTVLPH